MRISEYYNLGKNQSGLDFIDIRLDTDVAVFIDPTAIHGLQSKWGHELASLLQTFFETVLDNIKNGKHTHAKNLLSSLSERNEFHLGFSKGKSRGHAFGTISANSVWGALMQSRSSLTGLLEDLEDTCLMIHGIGPDMISDAVCNILRGPLIKYTQDMCEYYGIPLEQNISSGPIWNPVKGKWEDALVSLPLTPEYGKFILIPKNLVRLRISYKSDEYYRHYILPELQSQHINNMSPLVNVLKNGRLKVHKTDLIDEYGADKLAVVEQTLKNPHVLARYRQDKKSRPSKPLTHETLAEVENIPTHDWQTLAHNLTAVPTGKADSTKYENIIESIFTALFYPSLCYPKKQTPIHSRRKIVDITYTNEARAGFFFWLARHYPSALMIVECKNYGNEVANNELDQLSGRFSLSRGQVGILVCRSFKNKDRFVQRCIDTAKDGRGYIIPIDDDDVITLMEYREQHPYTEDFPLLKERFNLLII
ncbi:MAG: hypothetical protein COA95_06770 [Methylophaga sp.]|nr:MAG: hypothetical protein COA95_06770 [Methylophaga sp.]